MSDSASNFITPNFGSFNVDSVPEPGTSLLMGILGLILAGRLVAGASVPGSGYHEAPRAPARGAFR